MKASDLLVKTLENEGVQYVFGIPGEEILDVMDSISRSNMRFCLTRHEQGAAFMAGAYGRLTGKAGVCLSTLGPGAMNLATGVADAFLDYSPLLAITGQVARSRLYKQSHQRIEAHKIWIARMYPAFAPNTVLISNGLAAMGFAIPSAVAAKLVYPERKVVVVCGDGGFLMSSQELETAKRLGVAFVTVVWADSSLGLIEWKQLNRFGHSFGVDFNSPDLVKYAESMGLPGFRVSRPEELLPMVRKALDLTVPSIIEVPIDYRENLKLTKRLGEIICPI